MRRFVKSPALWLGGLVAFSGLALVLAEAHAQGFSTVGEPTTFAKGETARYAIWYDKANDLWRLRTTSASGVHRFHGVVTVPAKGITGISSYKLEKQGKCEDHWKATSSGSTFDFNTAQGVDGLNFKLAKSVNAIHFDLYIDGKHVPTSIYIGSGNHHPSNAKFDLPAHP
jgi:hypothetical protein